MAPARSDGRMTELADPESPDDGGTAATDDSQPFGDWREQLRERVKEIRARKLASRRDASEDLDLAPTSRATADKLAEARAQAAEAQPVDTPPAPVQAEETTTGEALPRVDLDDFELGDTELDDTETFELEAAMTIEPIAEPEAHEGERPATSDSEADFLIADDAHLELDEDEDADEDAGAGIEWDADTDFEPLGEPAEEPSWRADAMEPSRGRAAFEQIPPELRDVDIPAWALPREPSLTRPAQRSAAAEEAAAGSDAETEPTGPTTRSNRDPDTYLVGEYTSPARKRVDLDPPEDTPVRTEDLLDKTVGELSALDEPRREIAPPGGLVNRESIRPVEPSRAAPASEPPRSFPGLFDEVPEEQEPATLDDEAPHDDPLDDVELATDDEITGVHEEAHEPEPEPEPEPEEPFELAGAPAWAKARPQRPEPAPERDEEFATDADAGLEWDTDEADVAAARQRHDDPTAPMADRVFSAVADGLVLLTIGLVLVIAGASAARTPVVSFVQAAPLPFLAAWTLFGIVYGVLFIGTCGQTLGKMAMRVRVIGAERFHVGYGTAALRAVAYGAAALPAGLGLLPALKDPQHRGLHDRLTGTRVVKA